mgnify:CR=1 FL=1
MNDLEFVGAPLYESVKVRTSSVDQDWGYAVESFIGGPESMFDDRQRLAKLLAAAE